MRLVTIAILPALFFALPASAQSARNRRPMPVMTVSAPQPDEPARAASEAATNLAAIEWLDDNPTGPQLGAVITYNSDAPTEAAKLAKTGRLRGHTLLIKDNIETREWATTAGSLALKDNRTGRDAPLVARLRADGGVILGKTNLSEWANIRSPMSSSGWSAVGGQTKNPYATDRSPCGSSSGSGAAVAAGMAWAAIGTETDGSITCPASMNGLVGFKPTVGLVSRTYVVPISHSQDTPGPMTTSVADAALVLSVIAGSDPLDAATVEADRHKTDYTAGLATSSLKGVRIGVLTKQVGRHPGVKRVFDQAQADLVAAGAVLVPIDYDFPDAMGNDEGTVLYFELREDMAKYLAGLPGQGVPSKTLADLIAFNKANADTEMRWFGQESFERAEKNVDRAAHDKARANSLKLAGPEGIDALLAKYTVVTLVAPTEGPAGMIDHVTGDHFLSVGAGSLAAIAGYPHLTVPMGQVEGMPVGLSFIGAQWDDQRMLGLGAAYERARTAVLAKPRFQRWGE
ncbi:MAG: amidase [Novosphingobium sp.]